MAADIRNLVEQGSQVVIVSSGAIALGMSILGLKTRPKKLSYLQAAAAIGQNELMNVYRDVFNEKGLNCAQVLLTWEDFADRKRYLNAKNTLLTLLKMRCIPVINENDTVSTDEIKFGDNDKLSSLVAGLVDAQLLVILSDVDGLLDRDKKVVRLVTQINSEIKSLACPSQRATCVGGMLTKIEAARIAVDSGLECVIANGRKENIISSCVGSPESCGTLFISNKGKLAAKHRWLAFSARPKGRIKVDDGAKRALLDRKSLLSVGITSIEGHFDVKDAVSITDDNNAVFAIGRVNVASRQLEKIKGIRYDKEVIHRDNIVIL